MNPDQLASRVKFAQSVLEHRVAWSDHVVCLAETVIALRGRAAAKAEVERLRALVETAYAEGYRNGPFANWHASNAKKAMEETT